MKTMKEAVKEQFGVDTLTSKEMRAYLEELGFTKEEVKEYWSILHTKEEVNEFMNSLYPEGV